MWQRGLVQKFWIILPAKVRVENSTSSVYSRLYGICYWRMWKWWMIRTVLRAEWLFIDCLIGASASDQLLSIAAKRWRWVRAFYCINVTLLLDILLHKSALSAVPSFPAIENNWSEVPVNLRLFYCTKEPNPKLTGCKINLKRFLASLVKLTNFASVGKLSVLSLL